MNQIKWKYHSMLNTKLVIIDFYKYHFATTKQPPYDSVLSIQMVYTHSEGKLVWRNRDWHDSNVSIWYVASFNLLSLYYNKAPLNCRISLFCASIDRIFFWYISGVNTTAYYRENSLWTIFFIHISCHLLQFDYISCLRNRDELIWYNFIEKTLPLI